jgi:hypothetical protein
VIVALLASCWPWIPGEEGVDPVGETDVADSDGPDSDGPDSDDSDAGGVDDTDSPAAWRLTLVYEQSQGEASAWAELSACADARVDQPWTDRLIDVPGACHAAPAAPPCLPGPEASVIAHLGRADQPLVWDDGDGRHTGVVDVLAGPVDLGVSVAGWTDGPPDGRWDDALRAAPLGGVTLTEAAPGGYASPLEVGAADLTVRWTGGGAGSVYVRLVGGGPPYGVVRCLVPAADGQVALPAALFAGWEVGQTVTMSVGLATARVGASRDGVKPVGVDLQTRVGWAQVAPP